MLNKKDAIVSGIIKQVIEDFGFGIFLDGRAAGTTVMGYFPDGQLLEEKAILNRVLSTGALEFITALDQYDYETNRRAALFVLTEYEHITKEWAKRVLSWFDAALGYDVDWEAEDTAFIPPNDDQTTGSGDYQSPVDALLDQSNTDNIVLYNENNEKVEFEQIALVPMDGMIYAILKPVEDMAGVDEDEALVFVVDEYEDESCLMIVDDNAVVDAVFEQYYEMLREAGVDVD